jgi:hypothetical protein
MDRGVIAALKTYYLRQTFMELVRDFDKSVKTMRDYWRSFDILKVINNIDAAWEEVSVNCLTGVWLEFLPQYVHLFAGFEPVENMLEDVRRLAQEAGLDEVRVEHVKELLDSHGQQQSNADLKELAKELSQQRKDEKEKVKDPPLQCTKTGDLQRILSATDTLTDEL